MSRAPPLPPQRAKRLGRDLCEAAWKGDIDTIKSLLASGEASGLPAASRLLAASLAVLGKHVAAIAELSSVVTKAEVRASVASITDPSYHYDTGLEKRARFLNNSFNWLPIHQPYIDKLRSLPYGVFTLAVRTLDLSILHEVISGFSIRLKELKPYLTWYVITCNATYHVPFGEEYQRRINAIEMLSALSRVFQADLLKERFKHRSDVKGLMLPDGNELELLIASGGAVRNEYMLPFLSEESPNMAVIVRDELRAGALRVLLSAGADPNARFNGAPALCLAIAADNANAVHTLIDFGADKEIACSDSGESAMEFALRLLKFDAARAMQTETASPYLENEKCMYPLQQYFREHIEDRIRAGERLEIVRELWAIRLWAHPYIGTHFSIAEYFRPTESNSDPFFWPHILDMWRQGIADKSFYAVQKFRTCSPKIDELCKASFLVGKVTNKRPPRRTIPEDSMIREFVTFSRKRMANARDIHLWLPEALSRLHEILNAIYTGIRRSSVHVPPEVFGDTKLFRGVRLFVPSKEIAAMRPGDVIMKVDSPSSVSFDALQTIYYAFGDVSEPHVKEAPKMSNVVCVISAPRGIRLAPIIFCDNGVTQNEMVIFESGNLRVTSSPVKVFMKARWGYGGNVWVVPVDFESTEPFPDTLPKMPFESFKE